MLNITTNLAQSPAPAISGSRHHGFVRPGADPSWQRNAADTHEFPRLPQSDARRAPAIPHRNLPIAAGRGGFVLVLGSKDREAAKPGGENEVFSDVCGLPRFRSGHRRSHFGAADRDGNEPAYLDKFGQGHQDRLQASRYAGGLLEIGLPEILWRRLRLLHWNPASMRVEYAAVSRRRGSSMLLPARPLPAVDSPFRC
jgi:hypothetical protein